MAATTTSGTRHRDPCANCVWQSAACATFLAGSPGNFSRKSASHRSKTNGQEQEGRGRGARHVGDCGMTEGTPIRIDSGVMRQQGFCRRPSRPRGPSRPSRLATPLKMLLCSQILASIGIADCTGITELPGRRLREHAADRSPLHLPGAPSAWRAALVTT